MNAETESAEAAESEAPVAVVAPQEAPAAAGGVPDVQPPAKTSKSWMPDSFTGLGAAFCTVAVFIILGVWIGIVATTVGTAPTVDKTGKVIFDEFGNAKDILLAILPLATTSLGYWYGNKGTADAQDAAATAKADTAKATAVSADAADKLNAANEKLQAVLDQAPPGTMDAAAARHPALFPTAAVQPKLASSSQAAANTLAKIAPARTPASPRKAPVKKAPTRSTRDS